jgi:hypothetical protein
MSALILVAATTPCFAKGGFGVTARLSGNLFLWTAAPNAKLLVGDFTGDGRDDFAVTGTTQFGNTLLLARSDGAGGVITTTAFVGNFATWAAYSDAKPLMGDFNHDGKADIALVGHPVWDFIPVAFSNGDGTFDVRSVSNANFTSWSSNSAAVPQVGDYNGDGRADIALLGVPGWSVVPIAFSNGDGSFNVTVQNNTIATWASVAGAQPVIGDFNGDGKSDICLTGASTWSNVPVALSRGDGKFDFVNQVLVPFANWAALPGVKIVPGDFNGDHKLDIALTGGSDWSYVPVAFANGDGTFNFYNLSTLYFPGFAATANARVYAGDFDGDGRTDLTVTGPSGWNFMPVAFSNGDGSFYTTIEPIVNFAAWAPSVASLTGDFNGDHKTDLALIGTSGWLNLPIAFSLSPP